MSDRPAGVVCTLRLPIDFDTLDVVARALVKDYGGHLYVGTSDDSQQFVIEYNPDGPTVGFGAGRPEGGRPAGDRRCVVSAAEDCCCGTPGCDGTGPWPEGAEPEVVHEPTPGSVVRDRHGVRYLSRAWDHWEVMDGEGDYASWPLLRKCAGPLYAATGGNS